AHSYERTAGYYFPFAVGAKIVYAQSIDTLNKQFAETKPTIVTSVPILFNKMYTRLIKNSETLPFLRKKIFNFALSKAKKYGNNKKHLLWKLSDKLVFTKIRKRLGGNIRFFISGGSALNKEVAETFDSFGITILEGYGMTEASPVIAVNRPGKNKFGTVGIPLDGVNVKIAGDGEIIVNGDNVMKGYYKDKAETDKTVINGWLHTGDIGEFDEDGVLKITDRKKTLFKTAGGKYISLTHIEETISRSKYIEQIIAFGGDRMFVAALIVPEFEEMTAFAKVNDISAMNNEDLVKNPYIIRLIESEINKYQSNLAKYERVRKFTLVNRPFSIETGELTPTMKIKRKVIEDMYKEEIENMYEIGKN
ncbi:MAG: AMP-dependent synthetase/ligase, partial [Ignavibacteria bacterium]